MSVPDFQSIMLPLLEYAGDNVEHSIRNAIDELADRFKLSPDQCAMLLPSGKQAMFDNRVGWARTYLQKAGLLKKTRRGYFQISELGLGLLKQKPAFINVKFLKQYPEFNEFHELKHDKETPPEAPSPSEEVTPEEALEAAYQQLRDEVASELLSNIKACTPAFFEQLVVDVLVAMGYGGSRKEAGRALGKSGDGGIDGIIKEDRLGLDIIYLQAKRWDSTPIGRPEIQKFAGALAGQRAKKGIFLTTSSFTKDALEYVAYLDTKIVLIDGVTLTDLMMEHNVGVTPFAAYQLKRIDADYFVEE